MCSSDLGDPALNLAEVVLVELRKRGQCGQRGRVDHVQVNVHPPSLGDGLVTAVSGLGAMANGKPRSAYA